MYTIAFYLRHLTFQGTEVAAFDYADYNERVLGNRSIIVVLRREAGIEWNADVFSRFSRRFPIYILNSATDLEPTLRSAGANVLYTLTYGSIREDARNPYCIPTAIQGIRIFVHAVFESREPHGDGFAVVSNDLNVRMGTHAPVLPHIVAPLPSPDESTLGLRVKLGIAPEVVVLGRHGAVDIPFVRDAVVEAATSDPTGIAFVFLGTVQFCTLPNVYFLPANPDLSAKCEFIDACDAMLHATSVGETFGLAVAEFTIRNKPVLTFAYPNPSHAHIDLLGGSGILYHTKADLLSKMRSMKQGWVLPSTSKLSGYFECTPEKVMQVFKKLVIADAT